MLLHFNAFSFYMQIFSTTLDGQSLLYPSVGLFCKGAGVRFINCDKWASDDAEEKACRLTLLMLTFSFIY